MARTPHKEHEVYVSNCIACITEARRELEEKERAERVGRAAEVPDPMIMKGENDVGARLK